MSNIHKQKLLLPDAAGERITLITQGRDWDNLMSGQSKERPERKHG